MSKRNRPTPSSSSGNRYQNQNEFRTLFSKRPVLIERQMDLNDFPLIRPLFVSLGWEPVTTISASVPIKLVQEFYANFYDTDFELSVFHTTVNRSLIRVTPDIIAFALGIDRPSPAERPSLFYPTQDGISPSKDELSNVFNVLSGFPPWRGETYVHGHLKTDLCTSQFQSLHRQIDNWGAFQDELPPPDDDDDDDDTGFGSGSFGGDAGPSGGGFDDGSGFF